MKANFFLLIASYFCLPSAFYALSPCRYLARFQKFSLGARSKDFADYQDDMSKIDSAIKRFDSENSPESGADFVSNMIQLASSLEPREFNITSFFLENGNQFDETDTAIAAKLRERGFDDATIRNTVMVLDVKYRDTFLSALFASDVKIYTKPLESSLLPFLNKRPTPVISLKLVNRTGTATVESVLDSIVPNAFAFGLAKLWFMKVLSIKEYQEFFFKSLLKEEDEEIMNSTFQVLRNKYWTARSKELFFGFAPTLSMWLKSYDKVISDETNAGKESFVS